MDIQQNSHMPVLCTGETNASISDGNQCCQEEVEPLRGNSNSVRMLDEFRRIYEERLLKIEEETLEERTELKIKTLTSWINDLGEQNLMLVETVEQLEREAADRVILLEERLKKSSHIALEYLSKLEDYDNQFLNQSVEKVQPMMIPIKTSSRLVQAQQTEEILKTRIGNLQNDISGLLELIRRARYEGSWDTNGLSFLEVTYEDIFGLYPHQATDHLETADPLQTTVNMLQQKLGRALEDNHSKDKEVKSLQGNIACQRADMIRKDLQIKNLLEKIQELQSSSCNAKEKKGVSFASPTKEDYKLQVQDLQKALKQAQNGTELATAQHCGCQDDKVTFAKNIEECRVNIVLAQAAIEETVEELNAVTDVLHGREEKIHELEIEIQSLQNSLVHSQQDIHFLLKPVKCDEEHIINTGETFLSYLTKVQALSEQLKFLRSDVLPDDEKGPVLLSSVHKNIPEGKSIKEIDFLLEELSQQEKEVSQRYFEINNFEDKLKILCSAMKDIQKNVEDYQKNALSFVNPKNLRKEIEDFEKTFLLYEKMHESQLRVIENLQEEIEELKTENKILQTDIKKCTLCSLLCKNCNVPSDIDKLRVEIQNLKSTVSANEAVILYQREMLNIQQEGLIMSQEEVKELQNQLKNLDGELGRKFETENLSREEEKISIEMYSEKQETHELMRKFPINISKEFRHFEIAEKTESIRRDTENLKKMKNLKHHDFRSEINRTSTLFKMDLNDLRFVDAQDIQGRKQVKLSTDLPLREREAMDYCDYLEYEINKLEDLLINFQLQINSIKSEERRPIDCSDSQTKVENLERILNETSENYEMARNDCCKYQEQLLNAAKREVIQQENFTAEERYWLEKMCQVQAENLRYLDIFNILNEEVEVLHLELHERDCQLQNTVSSLRDLTSQTSVLQKEFQKQEKNVEILKEQLLSNNIKLQEALTFLDVKNKNTKRINKEYSNTKDNFKILGKVQTREERHLAAGYLVDDIHK